MTIDELIEESWSCSEEKGWHEGNRALGTAISLIHSELSEALEEARIQDDISQIYYVKDKRGNDKPMGFPTELADAMIRIADEARTRGVDLEEAIRIKQAYNRTRLHRHGGKKF